MKVGLDQWTLHHLSHLSARETLDVVRAHGLDGFQFGDVRQISPTLDQGEIRAVSDFARAHGMYLEVGLPCPNPHLQRRTPGSSDDELRTMLRRHLEAIAVAAVGSRAVRCFIGGPGDRHNGPVPWTTQIADTLTIVRDVIPVVRDLGLKLAFENHAEATTTELIDIATDLGTDVAGICLDTGNLAITLEDPLLAVRRAAPYTVATHLKDGIVTFADDGLVFNARPCGQGVLPLDAIVRELSHHQPALTLSIEDHDGLYPIPIFHDAYVGTFPQVDAREFAHVIRYARDCEQRIAAGTLASPADIEAIPWEERALPRVDISERTVHALVREVESQIAGARS